MNNRSNFNQDNELVIVNLCTKDPAFFYFAESLAFNWRTIHKKRAHQPDIQTLLGQSSAFESNCTDKQKIKIYIIGHCNIGKEYLADGSQCTSLKIHYRDLAVALAKYIDHHDATVNLISCFAAKGNKPNSSDSFAANLHRSFIEINKDKDIPVVARPVEIDVMNNSKKTVRYGEEIKYAEGRKKLDSIPHTSMKYKIACEQLFDDFCVSKQLGSKIIFKQDNNGEQISVDAYADKWKRNLLQYIKQVANNATTSKKKQLLETWFVEFNKLENQEILHIVKEELKNPSSILKRNNSFLFNLFGKVSDEYNKIQTMYKEGKKIIGSSYTQPTLKLTKN